MKINGINISISESHYNKSNVQRDGVTHKIDSDKQYQMYMLELHKVYFDTTKEETLKQVITDLEAVMSKLKQIQKQNKEEEFNK